MFVQSISEKSPQHKRILESWSVTSKKTGTQLALTGTSHHRFWVKLYFKINKFLQWNMNFSFGPCSGPWLHLSGLVFGLILEYDVDSNRESSQGYNWAPLSPMQPQVVCMIEECASSKHGVAPFHVVCVSFGKESMSIHMSSPQWGGFFTNVDRPLVKLLFERIYSKDRETFVIM